MNIQESIDVLESVIAFESIVTVKEAWKVLKDELYNQERKIDYLEDTLACMRGEIAALKSGTHPTDIQQLKAKIAAIADGLEIAYRGADPMAVENTVNDLRQLSAV